MEQRFMAGRSLADLRRRIAVLEGRPVAAVPRLAAGREGSAASPSEGPGGSVNRAEGVACADVLPLQGLPVGGLARGALHEIAADESRQGAAAAGFALALVAQLAARRDGAVLWAADAGTLAETGALHGDGLNQWGLDPARLLMVRTRTAEDTLWALEEGAGCRGLVCVVGEFQRAPKALDLTATRRLALRARAGGVTVFVLRHAIAQAAPASAAATRWRLAAAPSGELGGFAGGVGRPAWRVRLERNRQGRTGSFDLEWNHDERIFQPATHSQPVAAAAGERPDRTPGAGLPGGAEVVALRRGGW